MYVCRNAQRELQKHSAWGSGARSAQTAWRSCTSIKHGFKWNFSSEMSCQPAWYIVGQCKNILDVIFRIYILSWLASSSILVWTYDNLTIMWCTKIVQNALHSSQQDWRTWHDFQKMYACGKHIQLLLSVCRGITREEHTDFDKIHEISSFPKISKYGQIDTM